ATGAAGQAGMPGNVLARGDHAIAYDLGVPNGSLDFAGAPLSGWSDTAHDDSAWTPAVVTMDPSTYVGDALWSHALPIAAYAECLLREHFAIANLAAVPAAFLNVQVDEAYHAY